jgi:hypothetical protein
MIAKSAELVERENILHDAKVALHVAAKISNDFSKVPRISGTVLKFSRNEGIKSAATFG